MMLRRCSLSPFRTGRRSAVGWVELSPGTWPPCGCWWPMGLSTGSMGLQAVIFAEAFYRSRPAVSGRISKRPLPSACRTGWGTITLYSAFIRTGAACGRAGRLFGFGALEAWATPAVVAAFWWLRGYAPGAFRRDDWDRRIYRHPPGTGVAGTEDPAADVTATAQ